MVRPDRRWIRNCGRSLIPEPVWCTERQHPAYSPPQLGVDTQLRAACLAWLLLPPGLLTRLCPPWMPWQPELSQGPLLQRATTWSLGNTWGLTCSLCCALSPYSFDPENRTSSALHSSCSHKWSSARWLPIFASIQPLPLDPWSMLTLKIPFQLPLTHSFPFRLFLTSLSSPYTGDIQPP